MAPIAPFYADRLYMDLIAVTGRDHVVSVHLANFPVADENLINTELEARMQMAQDVTSMVLALRRKVNIKVRQPLQCIMIPVVDEAQKRHIEAVKDLIMSEVNVKEIQLRGRCFRRTGEESKMRLQETGSEIRKTDEGCGCCCCRNVTGGYC